MVKVISINMNGTGERVKRKWVGEMVKLHKPAAIAIQETHVGSLNEAFIHDIWDNNSCDSCGVASLGKSGGLCTIWNPSLFGKIGLVEDSNFLAMTG